METKKKKVYLADLKTIGQTQGLKGRFYFDKVPQDLIKTSDDGRKYIQFAIWPNREVDQRGYSHNMTLDTWEPNKNTNDLPF